MQLTISRQQESHPEGWLTRSLGGYEFGEYPVGVRILPRTFLRYHDSDSVTHAQCPATRTSGNGLVGHGPMKHDPALGRRNALGQRLHPVVALVGRTAVLADFLVPVTTDHLGHCDSLTRSLLVIASLRTFQGPCQPHDPEIFSDPRRQRPAAVCLACTN